VGVEVAKNLGAVVVGEGDVVEVDRAAHVDEVVGTGSLHDLGTLVEDLEDPSRAGPRALAHHDQLSEHHERRLEHQEIQTEGEDLGVTKVAVHDHPSAAEQHQGESQLGQVLDPGGPDGSNVGVLDVGPRHALGGVGEAVDLRLFLREGLHHANAVDVLVHDGRDLGQTRLGDPGDGEHDATHLDADDVENRHHDHGDEREAQLMLSMKANATTPMRHCTMMSGAKIEYIWTLRMSLLARLMSCPDCTRS
jgi:hypothetical protein